MSQPAEKVTDRKMAHLESTGVASGSGPLSGVRVVELAGIGALP